jgi:hypothetical protein
MPDWNKKFKTEYDAAKQVIAKNSSYERTWQPLVRKLDTLLGTEGFDGASEEALAELRRKITDGPSQTKVTEDKGILQAAGAWTDTDTGTLDVEAKRRAASLKFLRHVYLQNKFGNRRVWVLSLPEDFTDWPTRYLDANASTAGAVKLLLKTSNEHFSHQQRRYIGNSTQQALAWCHKAGITLASAAKGEGGPNPARDMVKRWFAESGLNEATVNSYISTLNKGFKDIIATLNKGHFVVTDWVPFRGTSDADELDFLNSEAFTFRSNAEGMDVVYVESSFFASGGNVLNGQANWTRIIVHELSHLVCGTLDVNNGQARYAWYGIGPHAGYPGSDCIRNAENWAFFAADCAGALSEGERNTALKII